MGLLACTLQSQAVVPRKMVAAQMCLCVAMAITTARTDRGIEEMHQWQTLSCSHASAGGWRTACAHMKARPPKGVTLLWQCSFYKLNRRNAHVPVCAHTARTCMHMHARTCAHAHTRTPYTRAAKRPSLKLSLRIQHSEHLLRALASNTTASNDDWR